MDNVKPFNMKIILLLGVFISGFTYCFPDDDIIGIWQTTLPNNVNATINFKEDSTFVTIVNKKIFAIGRYTYKDNVMTYTEDNGCQSKAGVHLPGAYRINFFKPDSMQVELIYDSCRGRRDINHMKLGKVEKSTQK